MSEQRSLEQSATRDNRQQTIADHSVNTVNGLYEHRPHSTPATMSKVVRLEEFQSPHSGRDHVTPLDQSGRTPLNSSNPTTVEATLSNATESNVASTKSNVASTLLRYDTIRYGRLTCAQKLTRWPA